MQNKHYFFLFGIPNIRGGVGGPSWLGQNPNFYRKKVCEGVPYREPLFVGYSGLKVVLVIFWGLHIAAACAYSTILNHSVFLSPNLISFLLFVSSLVIVSV